ncbi:MAG TPA: hypothetical protein VEU08_06730 [Vicinamibacterales bacterium]|nr:hypothetical protein [Vicinamibacterales bacterium]
MFSGNTRRFLVRTLLLYTLLTAVMTYPQVLHLRDGVHDDGDPLLNAWTLAWVAHALPTAPAHVFAANIFYPERRTLAYSETLIAPGVAAAPLRWIGVGPILVYNIVFLSGFIVSGVGVALLVRRLTERPAAGVLAGLVFAFLPYRIDHYPHLQLQQTQCLPFALWAFHRLLASGRLRDGILFGALTAGQVLSCMYYGLFLVPYFTVVCGTMLIVRWMRNPLAARRTIAALAVSAAIAGATVFPVAKAYLGAREVVGERKADEVVAGSATLWNYLGPPDENVVFASAFSRFAEPERRLFPGFIALALAIVGLARARGGSAQLAYALGLLLAVDVSLGFNGITYRALYDHVLPFRGLRIPARMGIIAGFSLAILAGYGAAWIGDRIRPQRAAGWSLAAIGALMLVEYASRPIDLMIVPTQPPAVYADMVRDVGDTPTAALAEFPAGDRDDPTYLYYSTFHWQHLVNGYSGFFPPWYRTYLAAMSTLPGDEGIRVAKNHEARYLIVHGERLFGARYPELVDGLDRRADVKLISRHPAEREGQHGEASLYRILY